MTLRITYPEFKVSGPGGPNSNVNTYYSGKVVEMKPKAEQFLFISKESFKEAKIPYNSFNNDLHWKIMDIDYWPTTLKWQDLKENIKGIGNKECIDYIKNKYPMMFISKGVSTFGVVKTLSVQEIVKIFLKHKDKSLMEKCELLHKEIYG